MSDRTLRSGPGTLLGVKNRKRLGPIVFGFMAMGLIALAISRAATSTLSIEAESGSRSGGAVLQGNGASAGQYFKFGSQSIACSGGSSVGYTRPFGSNAAWNVPACLLPAMTDAQGQRWVSNFWTAAQRRNWDLSDPNTSHDPSNIATDFGLSSDQDQNSGQPVYYSSDATKTKHPRVWSSNNPYSGINLPEDADIPWNSSWDPSGGSDGFMIIIDEQNGLEYNIWQLTRSGEGDHQCIGRRRADGSFIPYNSTTDICAASINVIKYPNGSNADIRTYEGNFPRSRGVGIEMYAMLTTPDEVKSGKIGHALPLTYSNSMFGPMCSATERTTSAFGTTCGESLAPAGQFETRTDNCPPNVFQGLDCSGSPIAPGDNGTERRSNTMPDGIRMAINLNDTEIENWLNAKGYMSEPIRSTARTFARALRDYGWMTVSTTTSNASFVVASGVNPETSVGWRELGIIGDGENFLSGLIQRDRVYAVQAATNTCQDGTTSIFSCHSSKSYYPNLGTAPAGPFPSISQNQPPEVELVINNGQPVSPSTSYDFVVNTQDDGNIVKVEVYNGTQLVTRSGFNGIFTEDPYKNRIPNMANNKIYAYYAVATDNNNFKTISAPVIVRLGDTTGQSVPVGPTIPPQPSTGLSASRPHRKNVAKKNRILNLKIEQLLSDLRLAQIVSSVLAK